MSGVAIALEMLGAFAPLTALIPGDSHYGGVVPEGTPPPALGVHEVGATDRHPLTKGANPTKVTARVQVTVVAVDYAAAKAAMLQVRRCCRAYVGPLGEFAAVTVHTDNTGPDFQSPEGFYMLTQDLRVTFDEE